MIVHFFCGTIRLYTLLYYKVVGQRCGAFCLRPAAGFNDKRESVICMTIQKTVAGGSVSVALEGRLDTTTSPELEVALEEVLRTATELVFDLTALEYISSSGLRVLLKAQKQMNKRGPMLMKGVNETVMEVFEVTGFSHILTFA